ncbi:M28 family peptidase [Halorubrum sp. JWXQ-INN 858]|uniref:M28 family peptidase n=1 Tax=Halorubrum sp. JWXQ-INN 858 TaxID=2690782 RepID=UPI00135CD9FC|nr:M28 family metallopeptidase [Halorubrum sp. JWXQ-INN 858]MWV63404.1 M28 family peptidase [Halorubrum sp. JWXQ-INN 858]
MTSVPPAAIGEAYTDTTAWELLAELSDLGDRMAGHEGEAIAAELIADALETAGVSEVTETSFPVPGWWREGASLTIDHGGRTNVFDGSHELVELPGSPSGTVTGEIVDMGYGLPEDFEDVDLSGTIAMASSVTPDDYGRWVHRSEKYGYAAESGAEAFLFYNHLEGALPPTGGIGDTDGPGPIPAVGLSKELGARLSRHCDAIDDGGIDATLDVETRTEPATSRNVEGVIGPDTDEEVLYTAHLDAHDVGTGANDNGFGSALVVSVARILASIEDELETKVRFLVVGAEEVGLYGSYYWTHTHDLDRVKAVVNMDGAGYSRDLEVHTHGFDAIGEAFSEVSDEYGIPVAIEEGLRPHSDHWPFVQRGVPGAQGRSSSGGNDRGWGHTHGDTLDKLDPRDLRELAVLSAGGVAKLAEADRPVEGRSVEDVASEVVEERFDVGMKATGTWPFGDERSWPWADEL